MGKIERIRDEHHLEERIEHYLNTGLPENKLTIISNRNNRVLLKKYPDINEEMVAEQSLEEQLRHLDPALTSRDLYHYARALEEGESLLYVDQKVTQERPANHASHAPDEEVIELQKERLAVDKETVNTGEVVVEKFTEDTVQEFDVPVNMENVTVERRPVEGEPLFETYNSTDDSDDDLGVIRIPVTRERIKVIKEKVVTEEIIIRKEVIRKMEHVSGTVRHDDIKVSEIKNEDVDHKN